VTGVLLKGVGGQVHDLQVAYGTGLMNLPGLAEPTVDGFLNLERTRIITFVNGKGHSSAIHSILGTAFQLDRAGILGP
jgi:hypothetical protein